MRYVFVWIVLTASSCSGVEKINNSALVIKDTAQSSHSRFSTINEEAQVTGLVDKELISSEAVAGMQEQESIIKDISIILKTIPAIEDSIPWWASLMKLGFVSLSVIGVLVLLWYLGLGYPIRALMRSFVSLIPSRKRESAKLLVKSQDDSSPVNIREAIAVMRATDKDFNAAYKNELKENQK